MDVIPTTATLDAIRSYLRHQINAEGITSRGDIVVFQRMLSGLESPNTKRIWFDSRQAMLFSALDGPRSAMRVKAEPPFPCFYLQFTEPILLPEQEPGFRDHALALLFFDGVPAFNMGERDIALSQAVMFFESDDGSFGDRGWTMSLHAGCGFSRPQELLETADPSELPPMDVSGREQFWLPSYAPLVDLPHRHVGWWERVIQDYTDLVSWICVYLLAKGVSIIEAKPSRQVRRALEREGKIPNPWHVVKIEPRSQKAVSTGAGIHHRHRYDVIAHLRLNRHYRKDGTPIETIEFVPSHQRGLANSLYVPKTYVAAGGRTIAPKMAEYFGAKPV